MWQWYQIDSLFQLWLKGKFSLYRKILKSGDFKFLQKLSSFFPIPLLPQNKKRNPIEENFHFFSLFPTSIFRVSLLLKFQLICLPVEHFPVAKRIDEEKKGDKRWGRRGGKLNPPEAVTLFDKVDDNWVGGLEFVGKFR
ncbi:MAG: hypothetical protein C6I01_04285, partial [Epsilonproteobacteria bacterium]|nr:hypothetical protein [Campylobacterota bacterium]